MEKSVISYLKNNGFHYMILVRDPILQGVKSDIFITDDNEDDYYVEPDVLMFPDD